jgi:hypothetical protein
MQIIIYTILIILALYFLVMFLLLRLIVPFMGFKKYAPPAVIPDEYKKLVNEWNEKSQNSMGYLKLAYDFVLTRWKMEKFKTAILFPKIFRTDLKQLWNEPGYLHCNTMNYVLFVFLVNGKYFTPDDIEIKHTILNFVTHQYMRVKVDGRWIDVDPAGSFIRNLPLGQRAGLY